jgi:hypothetical protein
MSVFEPGAVLRVEHIAVGTSYDGQRSVRFYPGDALTVISTIPSPTRRNLHVMTCLHRARIIDFVYCDSWSDTSLSVICGL